MSLTSSASIHVPRVNLVRPHTRASADFGINWTGPSHFRSQEASQGAREPLEEHNPPSPNLGSFTTPLSSNLGASSASLKISTLFLSPSFYHIASWIKCMHSWRRPFDTRNRVKETEAIELPSPGQRARPGTTFGDSPTAHRSFGFTRRPEISILPSRLEPIDDTLETARASFGRGKLRPVLDLIRWDC